MPNHEEAEDELQRLRLRGAKFELMRADVDSDMVTKGWTTQAKAGRFTQTANSVLGGGDETRHAVEHTHLPNSPMSLEEAEGFIKVLLADWTHPKG